MMEIEGSRSGGGGVIMNVYKKVGGLSCFLPPFNKEEKEIFRDDKGCYWIRNGIKCFNAQSDPKQMRTLPQM